MLNKYFKVILLSALLVTMIISFSEITKAEVLVNYTYTDGSRTNSVDLLDIYWYKISSNF